MNDPDLDVVLLARNGDTDAFGDIVEKYQPMITAMLHRFALNSADLEDLVQDSFIKAWRALPKWEPKQPFSHWLNRISVRTALEYCRKQGREPIESPAHIPDVGDGNRDFHRREALEEARHLLSSLPAEERALLTLVHLHGMSMAEAADHFGWSRAKAKIRSFRAKKLLRNTLKQHGYEE